VSEFWDCFALGSVISIDAQLRAPCVCQSVRPTDVPRALFNGVKSGAAAFIGFSAIGVVLDTFAITSARLKGLFGSTDDRGSFFPFRPPVNARFGPVKKVNMLLSAFMQLLDEITDIRVLITYFESGWWAYFWLSLSVLLISSCAPPDDSMMISMSGRTTHP